MNIRPNFPDLLDPAFRKIYMDAEKQLPEMRGKVFHEMTSSKNIEKDSGISGLSTLVVKTEDGAITYEDQNQGYDVTYTHSTFALGTSISKEMWDDDQSNEIKRKPELLAKARVRHSESLAADIFNYGTTAGGGGKATFTSGDAKALFATDHPRTDSGTAQSNLSTADLAEDAIETALVTMQETLDNKGQLMLIQPTDLLVPPALEKEARILLDSTQRVGVANNDINPYKGALNIICWPYIAAVAGGSNTASFLIDSSSHQLNWFWRERPNLDGPDYDFNTKSAKWSILYRASVGFSDWRGVFMLSGTNA